MESGRRISFMLPMYNESGNIEKTVTSIHGLASSFGSGFEVILIDDASRDATARIAADIAEYDKTIKLIRMTKNTCFGGAFAEGLRKAAGEVVVYVDSDMPVSIEDMRASIPLIDDFDIVTAVSSVRKGDTFLRKTMSKSYNMIVRKVFGLNVKDINSGYKVLRKNIFEDIDFISRSPFVGVELFLHAVKKNARIKEYPVVFRTRCSGKSRMGSFTMIFATFRDMLRVWSRNRRRK